MFVLKFGGNMITKTYQISGMNCNHCVMAVQNELRDAGIDVVKVEIGAATVTFDDSKINEDIIFNAIKEAGFQVEQ